MISCSLVPKEKLLGERGIKSKKDSTLLNMSKKDLLDEIRVLENNLAGEIWKADLQTKRVKAFSKYFKTDEFNRICNEEIKFDK